MKAELEKKDAEIKRLTRELDQVRMKSASSSTANIAEKIKDVKGVKVLAHRVDNLERAQLRTLVDQLRDKIGSGVVILGSASNGNVALIVGVTKDLTSRVQAGKVIGPVAQKVGGKGGGQARPGGSWGQRCVGAGCCAGRGLWRSGGIARMNSEDTVSDAAEERLRFIKHKGQTIFVVDFSHCAAKEILLLIEQVKLIVARHAPGSMLTLADFTGAEIDKKVATRMKEVLTLDRPLREAVGLAGGGEPAACVPGEYQELLAARFSRVPDPGRSDGLAGEGMSFEL